MKVHLQTLGCRLNESEIEQMSRSFHQMGHEVVDRVEDADLCVINTCAVTNEAGRKSRQLIYQAHRKSPNAKLVVTGCYSQIEEQKVADMPGVAQVIDNLQKDTLVPILLGLDEREFDQEPISRELKPGELGKTRAFIKIQDGCNNSCTFCVTTIARGAERSRSVDEIIEEALQFYRAGYKEIVLTGVHIGAYGRDLKEKLHLGNLIEILLEKTEFPRVRLSSLEPWNIPENFFALWQNPRMCRHLHLPLQAGCDATLRRMRRRTRKEEFRALVQEIRSHVPDMAISSDMIVGFPGETQADFEESLEFTKEMNFCHIHAFRYSPRPGTPAATMPEQVKSGDKSDRNKAMNTLAKEGRKAYYESMLGQEHEVLWEQKLKEEGDYIWWQGLTDHYIRVKTRTPRHLHNTICTVRLDSLGEDGIVVGQIV